jgi:hypothetical protein
MSYQCKICNNQLFVGTRVELTLVEGSIICTYVCDECRAKYSDDELLKIVLRKILN